MLCNRGSRAATVRTLHHSGIALEHRDRHRACWFGGLLRHYLNRQAGIAPFPPRKVLVIYTHLD